MTSVNGQAKDGFGPVRDAFEANFADRGDVGAAVAAYVNGEVVVDLWGGEARPGVPWQADTPVCVFSSTKGATALVVLLLADQGRLDVDTPIAAYWPEFGVNGKEAVTLRDVLSHRSGVVTFPDYHEVDVHDTSEIARRIAAAAPLWSPGTLHGYHALTLGWIAGEVTLRVTGMTLGTVFQDEIARPLGLDFWVGMPAELHDRVADLIDAPAPEDPAVTAYLSMFNQDTWTGQAHFVGDGGVLNVAETFNSEEVRSAEIPAGGGIGTAPALARMYAALALGGSLDGIELVSPESVTAFTDEQVAGPDSILLIQTRFGLGFARPTELLPMGPNDEAFGHGGLGGSLAFADPAAGVGFAYVPNQLHFPRLDQVTRAGALVDALYASL